MDCAESLNYIDSMESVALIDSIISMDSIGECSMDSINSTRKTNSYNEKRSVAYF